MINKQHAFRESVVDTAIGLPINVLVNWALLSIGLYLKMDAFLLSCMMTTVFTVLAIARKYFVRLYYQGLTLYK